MLIRFMAGHSCNTGFATASERCETASALNAVVKRILLGIGTVGFVIGLGVFDIQAQQACDSCITSKVACECDCHGFKRKPSHNGPRLMDRLLGQLDAVGDRLESALTPDGCSNCDCAGGFRVGAFRAGQECDSCDVSHSTGSRASLRGTAWEGYSNHQSSDASRTMAPGVQRDFSAGGELLPSQSPGQPGTAVPEGLPDWLDDPFKDEAQYSPAGNRTQARPVSAPSNRYRRAYDPQASVNRPVRLHLSSVPQSQQRSSEFRLEPEQLAARTGQGRETNVRMRFTDRNTTERSLANAPVQTAGTTFSSQNDERHVVTGIPTSFGERTVQEDTKLATFELSGEQTMQAESTDLPQRRHLSSEDFERSIVEQQDSRMSDAASGVMHRIPSRPVERSKQIRSNREDVPTKVIRMEIDSENRMQTRTETTSRSEPTRMIVGQPRKQLQAVNAAEVVSERPIRLAPMHLRPATNSKR